MKNDFDYKSVNLFLEYKNQLTWLENENDLDLEGSLFDDETIEGWFDNIEELEDILWEWGGGETISEETVIEFERLLSLHPLIKAKIRDLKLKSLGV